MPSLSCSKKPPEKGGFLLHVSGVLFLHVREKSHEACALDREGHFALVAGRESRAAARHDLCRRPEELFQDFCVLVVHVLDVVG